MVPAGATSLGLVVNWPSVKDKDMKNGEVRGGGEGQGKKWGREREGL